MTRKVTMTEDLSEIRGAIRELIATSPSSLMIGSPALEQLADNLIRVIQDAENARCLGALDDLRPVISWDSTIDHRVQASVIDSCKETIALSRDEDHET